MAYAAVTAAVTLGADTTANNPFSISIAIDNSGSTIDSLISKIEPFFTAPSIVGQLQKPQVGGVVAGVGNVSESARTTSSTPAITNGVAWTETQAATPRDPPTFALGFVGDTLTNGTSATYVSSGVINAAGTYTVGARITLKRADTGAEVQCIATTDSIIIS